MVARTIRPRDGRGQASLARHSAVCAPAFAKPRAERMGQGMSARLAIIACAATLLAGFSPAQPQGWTERGYPVWTEAEMALPDLPPAPPDALHITANLDGKVLGLKMIDADYSGWVGTRTYALRSDMATSGLGALLKKLRIWAVTEGRWDANGFHPVRHTQQNRNKKRRRVEMLYGADAVEVSVIPPNGSLGVPPASPAERFGADDTLTALLKIMTRRALMGEATCAGAVAVFDSKQRYDLRLVDRGAEPGKLGDYRGAVRRCDIYYEPVSGFDPEDLPDADEAASPVKVWFADVAGVDVPMKFSYKISGFKAVIKVDDLRISWPDGREVVFE